MSSVPVIPGIPQAGGNLQIGPQGISASFNLTMNGCNARPIMVYVTKQKNPAGGPPQPWPRTEPLPPGVSAPPPPPAPIAPPPTPGATVGGQIWRVIDPLSPLEKLPVFKEWTEEVEYRNGHWRPHTETPPPPPPPPNVEPTPPTRVRTRVFQFENDTLFKFDKPGASDPIGSFGNSFRDPAAASASMAQVDAELNAPATNDQGAAVPLPATVERKVVMFGHADMCAPFWYNFSLAHRRNLAIGTIITPGVRGALLNTGGTQGMVSCSDFNPVDGPNSDEQAAENATTTRTINGQTFRPGFAPAPGGGNQPNRRVELFVIPDHRANSGQPSRIRQTLSQIRTDLIGELGLNPSDWRDGEFPCPTGVTTSTESTDGLLRMCHQLVVPGAPHQGGGNGPGFRQCRFYQEFKSRMSNLEIEVTTPGQQPQQPQPQPQQPTEFTRWEWVEDAPIKETLGEYHPPRGEHYSYYMDEMVKTGVPADDLLAAQIAVAPNAQANPDDFNLLRPGKISVVKMDVGFWGDQRTPDLSRQAGFRREPARYFGLIEGQFVFLCYFETPENAGHVRWCSEGFDKNLTPLCDTLDQAVRQAGWRIRIIANTVADDGPDPKRLKVIFGDMHLPRKFDANDPTYAQDECTRRLQMLKSAILHQLKQDYRLAAESTPWLCSIDRELCKAFFEQGAPTLKLPHLYTLNGPTFSNPTEPEGDGFIDKAMDVVKKAKQFIYQVGNRAFEFTQDDYRRMTRKYPQNFPEKGYGYTKDLLSNQFYGSTTDTNAPGRQEGDLERFGKAHIPQIIQEELDEHAGTNLQKDPGTGPAQESYATIDAGPARDLLRFLQVINQQRRARTAIDVIQVGDLMELGMNRRFLFEDFHQTDDPTAQVPKAMAELAAPTPKDNAFSDIGLGSIAAKAGDVIKKLITGQIKSILGGMNANEQDLWFRRETDKAGAQADQDPDQKMLRPEEAYNLDGVRNDFQLPLFTAPSPAPGSVSLATDPNHTLQTPTIDYTHYRFGTQNPDGSLGPINATNFRGRGYLRAEAQRRINDVLAFAAPIRANDANTPNGRTEDLALLGGAVAGNNGLWNRAIVQSLQRVGATLVYGQADQYRGLPRRNGTGGAQPFYSENGLWVEHGHRFEDAMLDGQPLSSFLSNLAYEIQELPFGASLLDEYFMHREQSFFQPGIVQWFLLVQFGGADFLKAFQRLNDNVPAVKPFRIAVTGHTHQPDLVNAQIIFKDREKTEVKLPFDVPLIGDSISMETIVNGGGALLKGISFMQKIERWIQAFDQRNGFDKMWSDIGGNGIDWTGDFAGLAKCIDRAIDFIKQQGANVGNRLQNEFNNSRRSLGQAVNDNAAAQGLPRPF